MGHDVGVLEKPQGTHSLAQQVLGSNVLGVHDHLPHHINAFRRFDELVLEERAGRCPLLWVLYETAGDEVVEGRGPVFGLLNWLNG